MIILEMSGMFQKMSDKSALFPTIMTWFYENDMTQNLCSGCACSLRVWLIHKCLNVPTFTVLLL